MAGNIFPLDRTSPVAEQAVPGHDCWHPPLALLPEPRNAVLTTRRGTEFERVTGKARRTVPPRERCGNVDIKNPSRGARAYLPVHVNGGKFFDFDICPSDEQLVDPGPGTAGIEQLIDSAASPIRRTGTAHQDRVVVGGDPHGRAQRAR